MPYIPPPLNVSAGTTSNYVSAVTFSNANGVSFGLNGSTITASVSPGGGGLTNINVSAGTTSNNLSNVVFSNSNNVSFGLNGSTVTATATVASTQGSINLSAGTTSNLASAFTFNNSNGVSFGLNASTITATVKTDYLTTARASTDAVGLNTAQTNVTWTVNSSGISLNAGGYAGTGITTTTTAGTAIVGTNNTAGLSLGVPAFLTTAALSGDTSKYLQAWELTGNTAGTTSSLQGTKIYFSGGNNITVSGSSNTILIQGGAGGAGGPMSFLLSGNTTGNTTATGSTIQLSGGNGVTLSGTNNSVIGISVSTYSTIGTATTAFDVASANSVGTVTRWAAEDHRHAGIGAIGISTGNTTGTSGSVQGTYWIAGSNNLTVSQITSNNGSHTLVLVGQPYISSYEPWPLIAGVSRTVGLASQSDCAAFLVPQPLSASFLRVALSMQTNSTTIATSAATSNIGASIFSTWNAVIYSLGVGGNSKSLQSVAKGSAGFTQANIMSVAVNGTQYTITQAQTYEAEGLAQANTSTSYAISNTNYSFVTTNWQTQFTGNRWLDIPFANSLSAGPYWVIFGGSTSSSTSGAGGINAMTNCNVRYASHYAISQLGTMPLIMNSTNNQSGGLLGAGVFSTAGGGTTNSLPISAISSNGSNIRLYFQMLRSA